MMTKNQRKRRSLRVLVVLCLIALAVGLVMKLCGFDVKDWAFVLDSVLLLVSGVMYKNFDQAIKEDEKYGSR